MPTLFDIAIGLPILLIQEDARLRHERIRFYLDLWAAFWSPRPSKHLVLVEGSGEFGFEFVPEDQVEEGEDPFSGPPLSRGDIYHPEGVLVHAN